MKTRILSTMRNYILSRTTKTFARCWQVNTVDGQTYGYTSHTRDIEFQGLTYQSILGFTSSALRSVEGLNPDNISIAAFLSQQDESDIYSGKFDNASVDVFVINYLDVALGPIIQKTGYIGPITRADGFFSVEINSVSQLLQAKIGRLFNISCDARLGDARCNVGLRPVEALVFGSTTGSTLTRTDQGSFVDDGFIVSENRVVVIKLEGATISTTRINAVTTSTIVVDDTLGSTSGDYYEVTQANPFFVTGEVSAVSTRREFTVTFDYGTFDDHWFTEGNILFLTGNNVNVRRDIRQQVSSTIGLFLSVPFDVEVGDTFELEAGCIKTIDVCKNKFDNVDNFRGFPYIPTNEEVFNSPINSGQTIISAT